MRESEKGPNQRTVGTTSNRSSNNRYQRSHKNNNEKPQLKGAIEELKNNVYYLGNFKQSDNYDTVTRNIYAYIQRTMDHGDDIVTALRQKRDIDFDKMITDLWNVRETASSNQKLAAQR